MTRAMCEGLCCFEQRRSLMYGRAAGHRIKTDFKTERACDAIDFTGAQGEQQMARLKIEGAHRVHQTETSRDGPASIDTQQLIGRNFAQLAWLEFQPAQAQEPTLPQH